MSEQDKNVKHREPAEPKPLTYRQQQYVSGVLHGLSSAEAARQAGYGPGYSRQAAARLEKVHGVRDAIQQRVEGPHRDAAEIPASDRVAQFDRGLIRQQHWC